MDHRARTPSRSSKKSRKAITLSPIISCVLTTALCSPMSQSYAWYDDYQSCMSEVESNCQYTDFYLDGFPVHQNQYPDYAQCVEMGIQVEGCNSLQTNRPGGNVSNAPRETVIVVGSPPATPLPPIIATGPYQPEIPVTPIFVTPLPPTNTQVDNSAQKEREECLEDVELEYKTCVQTAISTHLTQYQLCEATSWTGWILNFISRGRSGGVPDTCGPKLDINRDLAVARCETNQEVNKQLCRID